MDPIQAEIQIFSIVDQAAKFEAADTSKGT